MLMSQFLKSRKTIRDYKKKSIQKQSLQEIHALLDEVNDKMVDHGVKLLLLEDGKDIQNVLEGKGGYGRDD